MCSVRRETRRLDVLGDRVALPKYLALQVSARYSTEAREVKQAVYIVSTHQLWEPEPAFAGYTFFFAPP